MLKSIQDKAIVPSQKFEKILNAGAIPSTSELEYEYDQTNSKVVFEYAKVNNFMLTVDSLKIQRCCYRKILYMLIVILLCVKIRLNFISQNFRK